MQNINWPYPIEWEKEETIQADILVLGGGIAGCMAAIAAARRKQNDLVLGNVLGSNMFNALGVGSVAALVGNGAFEVDFRRMLLSMLAASVLVAIFGIVGRHHLSRREGLFSSPPTHWWSCSPDKPNQGDSTTGIY